MFFSKKKKKSSCHCHGKSRRGKKAVGLSRERLGQQADCDITLRRKCFLFTAVFISIKNITRVRYFAFFSSL
jgi:hypothetical protein